MRDGWREVTLADVLTRSKDTLGTGAEPTILTVTEGNGLVDQFQHWGRRIATEDVSKYKVVRPEALVYNVYLLWLGAIGRNASGESAITSPVYEVFDVSSTCDPRYVEYLVRSDKMRKAYASISIGTVPRRRRTPWQAFLQLPIALPPLAEQRRIVDLIAAVDDAIEAAEAEADAAAQLLDALLDAEECSDSTTVASIADVSSGASWSKSALRDSPHEASSVLTISNTKPDGTVSGEPTYVAGLSQSVARVTPSSIVAIRTNGNHNRIGNVYQVPTEYVGSAVSAFQLVIEPRDPVDSAHLYWMLRRPTFQENVTRAASGSTGLGNIAASKLREMTIPWPGDVGERVRLVATFQGAADAADSARAHAESLRNLRSNLLTVLLSGEHEIPSSYDQLLNDQEAAA